MEKLPTLATSIVGAFYLPVLIVTLVTAIYSTTLIFCNGYEAIVVERRLRMDVMGSLYFIGAYAGGFFMAGSFGLFAFYLSEKLVMITQDRSQKSLINVFSQQPRTVWILVDGSEVEVPFESLQANDIVSLHAGQVIPIDGLIEEGNATIDQHMLTGEAQPVERGVDTVMFDKTGPLTLEQPNVARIHICNGYSATEVLTFAAAAEYRQTHPVARAILEEAARQKLSLPAIDHAHYDVGYGLRVRLDGKLIHVGSDRYMTMETIEIPVEIQRLKEAAIPVACGDEVMDGAAFRGEHTGNLRCRLKEHPSWSI